MTAQYTPGPWTIEGSSRRQIVTVHCIVAITLHISNDPGGPESQDEAEANARLIAAAPELLEALRQLLMWCDAPGVAVKPGYVADCARAAIAKAAP